MKRLTKELSLVEKIILMAMIVFLLGLVYYYFVDQPIGRKTKEAKSDIQDYQMMNSVLEAKAMNLRSINESLTEIKENNASPSYLASYNNGYEEMEFLNTTLSKSRSFNLSFSDATQDGDLVRRTVKVTFESSSYDRALGIVSDLINCHLRCLVSDINITAGSSNTVLGNSATKVSCTVTFYETLFGGMADQGLSGSSE